MRILAIAIGLLVALVATPVQAGQVVLHQNVEVTGGYIRLGDLFSDAGEMTEAIVAYAPAPGRRAIFDARWLYRVARNHRLAWRPITLRDRAVVTRFSHTIGRREIEDHILALLTEQGIDADMQVVLGNRMMRLHVPGDSDASIAVDDLMYDPRTGRVTAIVTAPAGDPAAQRIRVTGQVHRMRDLPVLARPMSNGQVIGKSDLKWMRVRSDRLQRDVIFDPAELIGRVPRHSLRSMMALRTSDVQRPVVVTKGSIVTMILRRPGMMLTAKGLALDNGSHGDTIKVSNTHSSLVVDAEVTGTNMVTVRPARRVAMN
jgi:flagellar basal body P-ring formation protein FlgA